VLACLLHHLCELFALNQVVQTSTILRTNGPYKQVKFKLYKPFRQVSNVSFIPSKKEFILNFFANGSSGDTFRGNGSKTSSSDPYLEINISRNLLDDIYSIKSIVDNEDKNHKSKPVEFNVQEHRNSNDITIKISVKKDGHHRLSILGNSSLF
jgi:hypothetical protein